MRLNGRTAELVKKVFLTSSQTRPTSLGSRLKRLRLAAAHSLRSHVCELAIDRQENMRFCRAEMPSYCVKALENTQSILCGLFLVCEHFCSGRTASHRTALDFRGIFVLLDAGGLSPAKEKRAKSTEKAGCPTHGFPARRWLIFSDVHAAGKNALNFICACGHKLCEAFSTACAVRLNGRTAFRPFQKGKNMVK